MGADLRIACGPSQRVEKRSADLWVEVDSDVRYTDVGIEDEKLILDDMAQEHWRRVVERRFGIGKPWLYKIITDRGRSLFLDVLPTKGGGTFLDVGSGWGQVAVPLSRKGQAFCFDVSLGRLSIVREIARQEGASCKYICGNFLTFPFECEQFDLVVFNGTLEWISLGAPDSGIREAQQRALSKARELLNPGGVVYVGIENSLGLKYLLGAPDDHTGLSWFSFLDEADASSLFQQRKSGKSKLRAKTWSLGEYREMFAAAGLEILDIYGCFPDYKIIRQMIPIQSINSFIMANGSLAREHSGSDGSELPFGDRLTSIYRLLAANNVAQVFCPSYAIVARRP